MIVDHCWLHTAQQQNAHDMSAPLSAASSAVKKHTPYVSALEYSIQRSKETYTYVSALECSIQRNKETYTYVSVLE
jgi:hypothetical protein